MQVFDCWDMKEMRKQLIFLCSHHHLFHPSLYLNFQASPHPPSHTSTFPDLLAAFSLSAICLSFSDFFFFCLNLKTMQLICFLWFPVLFQCCSWRVSLLSQLVSSPFCIQMYLPPSQHTTARQRNTESLTNFYFLFFFMQNREGRSPRSIFATVKITQWCGMPTNK